MFSKKSCLVFLLLFLPSVLFAHLPLDGVNAFVNGLAYPFLKPFVFMLVLLCGLYLGKKMQSFNKRAMYVFLFVYVLGVLTSFIVSLDLTIGLLLLVVLLGFLLATNYEANFLACSLLLFISSFLVGLFVVIEDLGFREKIHFSFGCSMTVFLSFALANHSAIIFKKPWQKIAIRVIASWVVAVSLLSLVYLLKNPL